MPLWRVNAGGKEGQNRQRWLEKSLFATKTTGTSADLVGEQMEEKSLQNADFAMLC